MIRTSMILLALTFAAMPAFADFADADGAAPVESTYNTPVMDSTNSIPQPDENGSADLTDNGAFEHMKEIARGDIDSCQREMEYCQGSTCSQKYNQCMAWVQGAVN